MYLNDSFVYLLLSKKSHTCFAQHLSIAMIVFSIFRKPEGLAAVIGAWDLSDKTNPAYRVKKMFVHEYDE